MSDGNKRSTIRLSIAKPRCIGEVYNYPIKNGDWKYFDDNSIRCYLSQNFRIIFVYGGQENIEMYEMFNETDKFFVRCRYESCVYQLGRGYFKEWTSCYSMKSLCDDSVDRDPWNRQFVSFDVFSVWWYNKNVVEKSTLSRKTWGLTTVSGNLYKTHKIRYYVDPNECRGIGVIYVYVTSINQVPIYCVDILKHTE